MLTVPKIGILDYIPLPVWVWDVIYYQNPWLLLYYKDQKIIKNISHPNWMSLLFIYHYQSSRLHIEGPKPATRGGWMRADQNFFRNLNRRPISRKSPKPSSVLAKVWNIYAKAKPTQKASNERAKPRSKSEANRENCRTDLPGPVWPVRWTGLTGLAYRSDRWHPENPRKFGFKWWISTKRPRKSMKLGG